MSVQTFHRHRDTRYIRFRLASLAGCSFVVGVGRLTPWGTDMFDRQLSLAIDRCYVEMSRLTLRRGILAILLRSYWQWRLARLHRRMVI